MPGERREHEESDTPVVPRGVRSEELMPAATGGRRSRGGGSMRFRFRRRKGGDSGNGDAGEPG
jgi:hypothetical protein